MKSSSPLSMSTGTDTRGAKLNGSTSEGGLAAHRPATNSIAVFKRGSIDSTIPHPAAAEPFQDRVVGDRLAFHPEPPSCGCGYRRCAEV